MSRVNNIAVEEVDLVRSGRPTQPRTKQQSDESGPPTVKRRSPGPRRKVAPPRKSARDQSPSGSVDTERRIRHITALLLGLAGLLILLALVSYSRMDQANTDIGVGELTGLLTNDPSISARAETTQNWLGFVGAFIADFLINNTIGWFALIVPALLGFWSYTIFSNRPTEPAWKRSSLILLLGLLGAGIVGTLRLVPWLSGIAYEGTGAVGSFLSNLLGGLTGTIGSLLILTTAIVITLLYAFDTDLTRALDIARKYGQKVGTIARERLDRYREAIFGGEEAPSKGAKDRRETVTPVEELLSESLAADNEPARMIRRVSHEEPVVDLVPGVTGPIVNRPSNGRPVAAPPPSPIATDLSNRTDSASGASPTKDGANNNVLLTERPSADRTRSVAAPAARPQSMEPASEGSSASTLQPSPVSLDRTSLDASSPTSGSVAPEEKITLSREPVATAINPEHSDSLKLRVHVEDVESDEDLEVAKQGKLIDRLKNEEIKYDPPSIELLASQEAHEEVEDEELKLHARLLQEKLRTFNIEIEDLTVTPGPVVTLFEFVPAAGIKLSQIESLTDDIALALKARGIRIIAPIPGKGTVGVEIPNKHPALVRIRSVLNTAKFREADHQLPLALGKTTVGEVFCADLAKMPHLLIAGATGAGKSVGINSVLASLLYKMHPSDLKLAVIDPKKIELTQYRALIDHFLVRCPDIDEDIVTDPQNAVLLLKSLELEMDRRYDMLAKSGQRNIFDYNKKIEDGLLLPTEEAPHRKLPYIVLIIDELADLMITAAKEVEEPIARLAQLARAIGIHMIVATQRPSVDVLTGMIKANFPARIAYQVASKIDSRTILDMNGAEQLLGNGDMLFLPGGRPKPLRLQNAFITTEEVEAICEHIGNQRGYSEPMMLPSVAEKKKQGSTGVGDERDDLFDEAARIVVRHQQGSVSLLQRRLKVGYARAARIVDELEEAGIVGSFDGSKARAVLLESEAELEAFL